MTADQDTHVRLRDYFESLINSVYTYIDTIREILKTDIDALRDTVAATKQSADKAIETANDATSDRFTGVNEFRSTLDDYVKDLLPRVEFSAFSKQSETDRRELRDELGNLVTRSELNEFKKLTGIAIDSLNISRATLDGKASQQTVMVTLILALIGFLGSGCSLVFAAASLIMRFLGY